MNSGVRVVHVYTRSEFAPDFPLKDPLPARAREMIHPMIKHGERIVCGEQCFIGPCLSQASGADNRKTTVHEGRARTRVQLDDSRRCR